MYTPSLGNDIGSWMDEKMISIGKDELLVSLVGLPQVDPLESGVGSDGHKAWRVYNAVGCVDTADPGLTNGGLVDDFKRKEIARLECPWCKVGGRGRWWVNGGFVLARLFLRGGWRGRRRGSRRRV
jgi:hypothetical protein